MRSREFLRRLALVRKRVQDEISAQARSGSFYGAGLANEGRLGGYLQALDDVAGMLRLGVLLSGNSDSKRWWRP